MEILHNLNQHSTSYEKLQKNIQVLQNVLLSIYDQITITDLTGLIIGQVGDIAELWDTLNTNLKGQNLLDLEQKTFFGESSILSIMKSKQRSSLTKTSWQGRNILVTGFPIIDNQTVSHYVWAYKNISEEIPHTPELESLNYSNIMNTLSTTLIVQSPIMLEVLDKIEMVSQVSSTVLLLGESGVGKEMFARAIHELSHRHSKPFIAVNCGAIPESLLESELFGYEEGAFTGSRKTGSQGKFELANNGILFLDEIGEMPLNLQVKLLRVLQDREITPLGGTKAKKIDIQVIAATNKSLLQLVKKGSFREDLYYRLNVVPIVIPTLRERIEEIPYLVNHFLQKYNNLYNRNIQITPDAIDLLSIYPWPGNVRELENIMERFVVTSRKKTIDSSLIHHTLHEKTKMVSKPPIIENLMPLQEALDLVEEQLISMAMDQYKSVKLAAKVLEVSQPTMSRKYKKIREKTEQTNLSPSNKRKILEEQLNKQLRSIAIVTAAVIQPDEIIQLIADNSPTNPIYQKLQKKLTLIREQEGIIEWVYIFEVRDNKMTINLCADEDFVLKPGEVYDGPPEIMDVAFAAMRGKVGVTPLYKDAYGEWKTSFAPVFDVNGIVVAIIGYDYSKSYISSEMQKLEKLLNIHI
ncbi:sigma-54 interaction domain-containing protein [Bacillus massiliigorillae]|uniref:sigma-54 interaction domain-containing protein n=1 Tax=Bacillus massiliigorillae TaxID=1243664 RepID=UPI003F6AF6FE